MTLLAEPPAPLVRGQRITSEELLALPDDGVERWIVNGVLRVGDVTRRNYKHSRSMPRISHAFLAWLETQPHPRGDVVDGEAGFRLRPKPDELLVGTDVAYIDADLAEQHADADGILNGVPVLVVEILSPSDVHEDVVEKIDAYIDCGVKVVWVVDPDYRTVTVYRPDAQPRLYAGDDPIDAEPHLPGFRAAVGAFFAR